MALDFLDDAAETPATSPPIPSTLSDDSKLEWLDDTPKTRKLAGLHDERRRLRRPTKTVFDAAEEFEPIQLAPFLASKPEIDKATDIYIAAKNVEANTDTEADRRLLNDFNEDRKRDTTLGYKVASIVTQLPAFAGELMATGGIYSAGRVAAQKMALKAVDGLLKKASEKALVKVGSKVAGVTGGAALQAGPAGALRAVETATERATPEISTSLDSTGTTIQATRTKAGETLTEAIPLAAVDSFIEVFSEHTGGGIGQVLKGAGRIASKVVPIPQKVQAFTRAAREWFRINPNSTLGEMMVKLRDRAYWNGWAAEIGEERVADILRPLLGVEEEFSFPSGEQLAAEAIAFAIPGAAARGVQTASELTLGATGYRQRQQDAAEQAEFERRSRLVADIAARQEADPRTRAPRETVPPPGAMTPEAQRVIEARQAADRGMMPPSPIPFEQPMVSPEMGITPQPLPVPPEIPAPERVNRENLVAIGSDVLNRYQSIPDLPPRAQALLPTIRRLLQRAGEDPTPVTLQNLASLLGLEYDDTAQQMPRQYSYVEGGRLSRQPLPAAPVPRRTSAAAPQEAPPISPVTPRAGAPRRRAPSQRPPRAPSVAPIAPIAPVLETPAPPDATVPEPAAPLPEPVTPAPATPVAPSEALNIGDPIRIMGVDSVLAKSETIDGVRYDLFNGAALKEKRAAVRVTDVDTGTVVTLQQHPTYDSAETKFNEVINSAKKTAATPVSPVVAPAPTPTAAETEVTTPEELKADTVKEPAAPPSAMSDADKARLAELHKRLRSKFSQIGSGVDPEILTIGAEMAGIYIKTGVKTFAQFARKVKNDLPDVWNKLKVHLKSIWEAAAVNNPDIDEPSRGDAASILNEIDQAEPTPAPTDKKQSEEEIEASLVSQAREIVRSASSRLDAYRKLVTLYNNQPRLGTRTAASKTNQAYSTPAPLAFLADLLADIQSGNVIVESTAGNGMLLIGIPEEAQILANELDPERLARLQRTFRVTPSQIDAASEDFHDYLTQWKPDRAVINPPFGSVIEEGTSESKKFKIFNAVTSKDETTSIDLAIALNTFDALTSDGKGVVIIGSKTGTMGPQFSNNPATRAKSYSRPEFLELFQRFNVVDWFTVSGDLYKKMGAGWPVDVVVIDGKRATLPANEGGLQRPWITPPQVFSSWESLESKLDDAQRRSDRGPGQPSSRVGSKPVVEPSPGRPRISRPGSTTPARPDGDKPAAPAPERPSRPERPVVQDSGPAVVSERGPAPPAASQEVGQPSRVSDEADTSGEPVGEAAASLGESLNVPYASVSKLQDPKLVVPRNIADAHRRAVTQLEKDVGKPVDQYIQDKLGWTPEQVRLRLSSAQVEVVALFIRNSEQRRTGIINSDGTGVGKGRTVATAIEYALRNGKIPVFITASKQLYSDMAGRDLPGIGNKSFTPFITDSQFIYTNGQGEDVKDAPGAAEQRETMERAARTGKLPAGVDGIFTTYYQLQGDKPQGWKEEPKARFKRKKKLEARPDGPRLAMLRALAPNAIFILDEAHLAAGKDSDVGLSLQSILKQAAGVYYASATFAKRPENLTLYSLGTALKLSGLDVKKMDSLFAAGGIPMQQALTSMLTEEGEFVRREQDFKNVDFEFPQTSVDPEREVESADTYTSFLRDLERLADQVNAAAETAVDSGNQARPEEAQANLSKMSFGSRLFQLSNQYLFSLRSASTGQKAIEALKAGRKPFIAVYNTMQGPIGDLQRRNLPLSFGGLLRREMQKMLEVKVKDPLAPGDPARGLKKGEDLIILTPEDLPDGGASYYALESQINSTDFSGMPISPIDSIKRDILKAGYSVGELTARDGEVDDSGQDVVVTKREKQERNKILSDYNNGKLDALIVNGSASTGLSAHTDPKFKDQRGRHMIVAQPAPDINVFMQILGRIMRFGQTKLPRYTILTTALSAERRFMTMLRGKLSSLNANTSAETESGITQGGLAENIFNSIGDQVVAEVMTANPELAGLAHIDLPDPENPESTTDYARRATGRFVLLPNSDADRLWNDITEIYQSKIRALDEAGENPLKANVEDLRAKTTGTSRLSEGTGTTAFDGPVTLERIEITPQNKPYTLTEAKAIAEQNESSNETALEEWTKAFREASRVRIETMRTREMTDEQIEKTQAALSNTYQAVLNAYRMLGETVGIDPTHTGTPAFYAVPISLELRSKSTSDFSSPSKHTLVFATNTVRRRMSLPLSQVESIVPNQSSESFDDTSESATTRYAVTGNLLAGFDQAIGLSANVSKPKVTVYTTNKGQIKTGVLLSTAWNPKDARVTIPVKTPEEFERLIRNNEPLRAMPGIVMNGPYFFISANSSMKTIWGDRLFSGFFKSSPNQVGSELRGVIAPGQERNLFSFLVGKGLNIEQSQTKQQEIQFDASTARKSKGEAVSSPVSESDATRAVLQTLGGTSMPSNITFTNDPDAPKGQVTFAAGQLPQIEINLAKHDSPDSVKDTLIHELLHPVQEDAGMASAVDAVAKLVSDTDRARKAALGYNADETQVEATNELIRQFYAEHANSNIFQRAVTSVIIAAKRLFGIDLTARQAAVVLVRDAVKNHVAATSGEGMSREQFASRPALRQFTSRPGIDAAQRAQLERVAQAQAALVPDEIAASIDSLSPESSVESRVHSLLKFLIDLRTLATPEQLSNLLRGQDPQEVKDLAVAMVLTQVEHVRMKQKEFGNFLLAATREMKALAPQVAKLGTLNLKNEFARGMAKALIDGYQRYMSAAAATLPADANIAAAQKSVLATMAARLDDWKQTPEAIIRAIQVIGSNASQFPSGASAAAIADIVRTSGMLSGQVSQEVIDLLTAPKEGGLPSLLEASTDFVENMAILRTLDARKADYARQLKAFESLFEFASDTPSSPVQLRQFANAYRKWRNEQADTQKIIRTIKADAKRLDEDISVYEMAGSILDQLQNHPDFRNAFEAALESSNALMKDFASTDPLTGNKIYTGPMSGTEYIIPMRPDRVADETALDQMGRLLEEVDEFLQQPDADPILLRSWKLRADYIRTFQYFPQFGTIFQTKMNVGGVRVSLNPFEWPRQLFFNRHRTIRTELEMMDFRAATDVMREVQLADGISREFSILRNHPEFGYAAITNNVLAAVKSHGLATDQIELWNLLIAEPIIASHQTLGMVQLKSGQLINGYKVTPEDIAAVETMKRFSNRSLQITQKADAGQLFRRLKLYNPLQIKTKFAGLSILRNAFGTGTMTMARVPSAWGEDFAKVWLEKPNRQARLEMIADGYGFRLAVMGYARESNPEFHRESQFEKYFRRLADVARTDPEMNFSSLGAFVDWLAQETVQDELYPDTVTAQTEIRTQLLREITAFVEDYRSASLRWEEDFEKEDGIPEPLMRMVTAKNSFTKPRIGLSAPSAFFSYSLAEDIRRTSYLASAYTVFQLRQLVAMKNLLRALESKRSEYRTQIKKMGFESGTKAAEREVQKKSHEEMAREGQTRFDYDTLTEKINLLNKIFNDFEALISDKPEAFDSILLYFLSQQTNLLSSLLLSSPQAIMNNTASGMLATPFIIEQNLGRASFLFLPRAAKAISGAMVNAVMAGFSKNKAVMRVLRSNLPVFRSLANDLADYMLEQQQKYGMAKEYGLINPADVTGRLQAQRQLRTTGGRIDFGRTGALISAANWVESFPGVRWALEQVKDKSPRLFDDIINRIVNEMQRGGVLTDYKQHAIRIFSGREERQQPLEAQILARELGLKFESDLDKTRMVFSAVGSFDAILLDYYRRWKAAPEADRHAVPLFTDPADETTVVFEFALRGNLTSPSNIPYAIQGVGYKGAVKRIVWMFWGMPIRIGEQIEKLSVRSSKDPRGAGLVHAVLQPILTLVFMALAGMGAWEIGQLLRELYAGRRSAQLRLANVAADPDTESIMRYTGIGLVYNLPYYGELISRFLGNPGYRGFMDVTEIIPAAGLVKDAAQSAIRIWQTGDAVYPLSDFMARWAPPLQPLQRLTPGLAGDIMAKNAARALSSVAPRDMELARERGGGGFYRQTPTTPEIRDLISAAYRNDSSGVLRAYERAVAARQVQGSEDPEGSVWQTITSKVPSRQVFGRLITEDEEARLLKRMSGGQRADYLASRDAFALIAQTLGKASAPRAIKDERRPVAQARTGQRIRGYATTRALLGSRRRPSFPRRRSLARRRRASMSPVRRRRTRRRQRLSFA